MRGINNFEEKEKAVRKAKAEAKAEAKITLMNRIGFNRLPSSKPYFDKLCTGIFYF